MNDDILVANGMQYVGNYIAHEGKGHLDGGHSGRFPWGSGKEPFQSEGGKEGAKQYIDPKQGGLTEEGKKKYNWKNLIETFKRVPGCNWINGYELFAYYDRGLDGLDDHAIRELGENYDLNVAYDNVRDLISILDRDGVLPKDNDVKNQEVSNIIMDLMYDFDDELRKDEKAKSAKHDGMYDGSDFIAHFGRSKLDGAPIGSGAHPLGSGEDPYQMFTRGREKAPKGLAGVIAKIKRHGGGTATVDEKKRLRQELTMQTRQQREKEKAAETERKAKEAEDKKRAAEEAERKKVEDAKQAIEDKKFRLLREGNVNEILKNQTMFSTRELQDAIDRASKLEQLNAKKPKQKTLIDKVDAAFNVVGKAANWIDTGARLANSIKKVQNLANSNEAPKTISLGQRYAAQLLSTINGKSLDQIDFNNLKSEMSKINTVNELYNMATKGAFGKSGGSFTGNIQKGGQQQGQKSGDEQKRTIKDIKKDTKASKPIFTDESQNGQSKRKQEKAKAKEQENAKKAAEVERKRQEELARAAEQKRQSQQKQQDAQKSAETERMSQREQRMAKARSNFYIGLDENGKTLRWHSPDDREEYMRKIGLL